MTPLGSLKTRNGREAGLSLVEVVIALSVMVLCLIGLLSGISYAVRLNTLTNEDELAMRGAQKQIEKMRSYPMKYVFACFNDLTNDTSVLSGYSSATYPENAAWTDAVGAVHYNWFDVDGLVPWTTGDACGIITFPGNNTTTLSEISDTTNPMYDAMGVDLNADGDSTDTFTVLTSSTSINILPVTLTVKWKGLNGKRTRTFRYYFLNDQASFLYPGSPGGPP